MMESLCIGIDGDKFDASEADLFHTVDGGATSTTHANDFDACSAFYFGWFNFGHDNSSLRIFRLF